MSSNPTIKYQSYGKSMIQILRLDRFPDRHEISQVTVDCHLEGDFNRAYTHGDNSNVVPTDTVKNTVYVLSKKHPVTPIENFAKIVANHFFELHSNIVREVRVAVQEHQWVRHIVDGKPHHHGFVKGSTDKKTVSLVATKSGITLKSGISDLEVLKSTGTHFVGFVKDKYTSLPEQRDRVFSTTVKAEWLLNNHTSIDHNALNSGIKKIILDTFATHDSPSVQATLYLMAERILAKFPVVQNIHMSMPNSHFFTIDLAGKFGIPNDSSQKSEVFAPSGKTEPFGWIEAKVSRSKAKF